MLRGGGGIVQKREVKAILFDLDGTLVDSFRTWFYVYNDSLKHFGFKTLSKKEFQKCFGTPIEHAVKYHLKGIQIGELEKIYNFYFKKRINKVKLFADTIKILEKLRQQKVEIGLITGSTNAITFAIMRNFKLKKYFGAIITMNDVKRGKPAPDMVLKACKMLKLSQIEGLDAHNKSIIARLGKTKNL